MKKLIKLLIVALLTWWWVIGDSDAAKERETYTVAMMASHDADNDPQ